MVCGEKAEAGKRPVERERKREKGLWGKNRNGKRTCGEGRKREKDRGEKPERTIRHMIEMENVTAGYGRREILHSVGLEIPGKGITTLIGANGSGKSTLLRVILGFLPLWNGTVKIDGIFTKNLSPAEMARKIAYLPQGKDVPDITAERMVLHGRFPYLSYPRRYRERDLEIVERAMGQMGILSLAGKHMSELSGGMRQKVYIAMALAQQAGIIVMDEPTTYLDIGQQLKFAGMMRGLAEEGKKSEAKRS